MKKLKRVFVIIIVFAVFFIISRDIGDWRSMPSGAGEIWWTQVPQIEQSYQNLISESR